MREITDFTAIDITTTGLSRKCHIVKLAAVRYRNGIAVETFEHLVNPKENLDSYFSKHSGITDEILSDEADISEVLPKYISFLGEDILIGHNVSFDTSFISTKAEVLGLPILSNKKIDTLFLSRRINKPLKQHSLYSVADYINVKIDGLGLNVLEATVSAECYLKMLSENKLEVEKYIAERVNKVESDQEKNRKVSSNRVNEARPKMEGYRIYTTPSELHKATNMLKGIVSGIAADGVIVDSEMIELTHWCSLHENLRHRSPFSELLPLVETAIIDGVISQDEKEDILWVCNNFSECSPFYDKISSSIQYICGLVYGLLADKKLSDDEIFALKDWLNENDFLKGNYPFDELESIVCSILADNKITEDERNTLIAFMGNLIEFKDSYNLIDPDFQKLREEYSVDGVCALCPEIEIDGKGFCITGESYKCSRDEFKELIESRGGLFKTGVSRKTDYLVVGNAGNPCWAYACYGRKIEKAIELRKIGCPIQIINETDLWDALAD